MSSATLVSKNIKAFRAELGKADKDRKKAGETAVKVEAFRLKGVLQQELKTGSPGGRLLRPLTVMAKRSSKGVNRRPLKALSKGVRYKVDRKNDGGVVFSFGFLESASKKWVALATVHQEGFIQEVTPRMRRFFRHRRDEVAEYKSWRITGLGRFFNLKESTTHLKTEKRPLVKPFWRAHEKEAGEYILSNFNRKMRGDRI